MKRLLLTACLLAVAAAGCRSTGATPPPQPTTSDVALLERYLTGAFSSAAQAAEDPDNYFDIRLVCVPIWERRDDGPWLYVEQAAAGAFDRPYRQRVYRLVDLAGDRVASEVYTLPGDPIAMAGDWRTPAAFDARSPEELDLREGCTVVLTRKGEVFEGGTVGEGCPSNLLEAAYATSEMTLYPDTLVTWDRGWTTRGEQAWGATEGGYIFRRVPMPE